MTETFNWRSVGTPSGQVSYRVLVAQYGDGYSQEVGDGINTKVQSWPLQFAGSEAEMQQIIDFFDRHAGAKGFFWKPPLGVVGLYKVASHSPSHLGGDTYTVSATFQQKFAP